MTTHRLLGIVGVLILALPALGYAQQAAPSGEELYIDRLGCWNCHGSAGEGGSGPGLAKTQDPLWKFIKYVRLPNAEMPAFAPVLASDDDVLIVYEWLEGVDAVAVPPPITFELKQGGQTTGGAEVEVTASTRTDVSSPDAKSLRYRITLLTREDDPVANQDVEYHAAGREGPSTITTDEQGQAILGPEDGFVVAGAEGSAGRLRVTLPAGRYALVIEAIDGTEPASPVAVGAGTAVFNVQ